jgi:hypothetical protein
MLRDDETSIPYPQPQPTGEDSWFPYYQPSDSLREESEDIRLTNPQGSFAHQLVVLVAKVDQLTSIQYGKHVRRPADIKTQTDGLNYQLLRWYANLPKSLACATSDDSVVLPHVMLLQ